jgi:hypothetical protein
MPSALRIRAGAAIQSRRILIATLSSVIATASSMLAPFAA